MDDTRKHPLRQTSSTVFNQANVLFSQQSSDYPFPESAFVQVSIK